MRSSAVVVSLLFFLINLIVIDAHVTTNNNNNYGDDNNNKNGLNKRLDRIESEAKELFLRMKILREELVGDFQRKGYALYKYWDEERRDKNATETWRRPQGAPDFENEKILTDRPLLNVKLPKLVDLNFEQRKEYCQHYGYGPRSVPWTMIDLLWINDEVDVLEARLFELGPHVSTFIVVESELTASGWEKPSWVRLNFGPEIVNNSRILLKNIPASAKRATQLEPEATMNWIFDQMLLLGADSVRYDDDDIVLIIGEVHQVPSRESVGILRFCETKTLTPTYIPMVPYVYNFGNHLKCPSENSALRAPMVITGLDMITGVRDVHVNHISHSGWSMLWFGDVVSIQRMIKMDYRQEINNHIARNLTNLRAHLDNHRLFDKSLFPKGCEIVNMEVGTASKLPRIMRNDDNIRHLHRWLKK